MGKKEKAFPGTDHTSSSLNPHFFVNAIFVLIIYLHFITEHLFSWKYNFVLTPFHSTCQTSFLTYLVLLVFHYSLEKVVTEWHEGAINFSTRLSQCQQFICRICYKVSWASDHLKNNCWWNSNTHTQSTHLPLPENLQYLDREPTSDL